MSFSCFASSIRSYDAENDGFVDSTRREVYSFFYDGEGREIAFESSYDEGVDGSFEQFDTYTYRFESFECSDSAGKPMKTVSPTALADRGTEFAHDPM